jgi:hypothetical protein
MLQLLYIDVSKVDRVLHLSSPTFCCIISSSASRTSRLGLSESEAPHALPLLSLGRHRPLVECETECSARASGCPDASKQR